MKMKKWEVLPKWPVDPESSDFCFHSDNYIFCMNTFMHFRSIKGAVGASSNFICVFVEILETCTVKLCQQLAAVWLTDGLQRWQTDRQQERGRREVTAFHVCLCESRKLTICGLHDTGVVVVAPGNASHRGHLGPLRVTRGAFRQPRHIGGRWVVICSERGVGS